MITLQPFDPGQASDEERLAVGQLISTCSAHVFPDLPPRDPRLLADGLLIEPPGRTVHHAVLLEDGELRGHASLDLNRRENLHMAVGDVRVHPEHRGRGFGRRLAESLRDRTREAGRSLMLAETTTREPAGEHLAASLGGKMGLESPSVELKLDEVDRERMARWRTPRPGYRLHAWDGPVPDEFLNRLAALLNVMNDAPRGELHLEDERVTPEQLRDQEAVTAAQGRRWFTLAAEDLATGRLVAFTEMTWHPERPVMLRQRGTGVEPEHRGRGLARWLKAGMLSFLEGRTPGAARVYTSNADANDAMRAINRGMGFRPCEVIRLWEIPAG